MSDKPGRENFALRVGRSCLMQFYCKYFNLIAFPPGNEAEVEAKPKQSSKLRDSSFSASMLRIKVSR